MISRQVLFFLAFSATVNFSVFCQPKNTKVKFTRIDVSSGLSNSNVTCFTQDSKGFLWVGTADGINKYDGYKFVVYRKVLGDTTSLLDNNFNTVFTDSRGRIWASTRNRGFYYYDDNRDQFVAIQGLSRNCEVVSISEDRDKTLWIAGVTGRKSFVAYLNRNTNRWVKQSVSASNNFVYGVLHYSADEYFLALEGAGLFSWNRKTNTIRNVSDGQLNTSIRKIILDADGNVWIATRNGLSKYDPNTKKFKHFRVNPSAPQNSLIVNVIRDLELDGKYLWMATENGGVSRFELKNETFTNFTSDRHDANSVSDNSVWSVYKDRQGRIWLGTFSSGICTYDKMKYKFAELDLPMENDIVNAIWKDKSGRIWVGTEGGLIMKQGSQVKRYTHDPQNRKSLPNNPVLSIFEDSRNRMWFGTWDGGVSRYDEQNDCFINFLPSANRGKKGLYNGNVYCISEDFNSHNILVATYAGLHVLIDENTGEFERYPDKVHEANDYLRTIFQDSRGDIWLGSITALNRFDFSTGIKNKYLLDTISGSGAFVNCIIEDELGVLWVGSNKGLNKIVNNQIVRTYTTKDGLPNDIVNGILVADNGVLWISTTKGISKFDQNAEKFINYNINDGLLSDEFKPNACFKSENGEFFFGGKGVSVFYPDSVKSNPYLPNVFLTGLKVFNKEVKIGGEDGILNRSIQETKEISLAPGLNVFTLEYVAVNFTASYKNAYAYKLEGFDEDWVYEGNARFVTYTNLDPGTYTFKVKASNNDGLWNEAGASIVIHVLPFWWRTWWFKACLVVMLVLLAVFISVIRTRNIRRVNRMLELKVQEKTLQIQEQNRLLKDQQEELAAQNEELIQSQEEIASQRDLVSQQNVVLSERQAQITEQNENLEREVAKRTSKLIEYNQQLEQFAFITAHNLRAPVARILGLGQLLELAKNNNEDQSEIYPKLVSATRELDEVVKDLNVILELKKNNDAFVLDVDLRKVIDMILNNLEKEIQLTGATVLVDVSEFPVLRSVRAYVDSILYNLISNSIKYRHWSRSPEIAIKTKMIGNEVCLVVSDNGLGIDLENFGDKVFSLYRRFHSHVEGKGMGLYLVKTQIEILGGRIEVKSEVGIGTTFLVYFRSER